MSQAGKLTGSPGSGILTITADDDTSTSGPSVLLSGGSTGLTSTISGTTWELIGTVNVPSGGTGQNSFLAHAILIGNGTGAISEIDASIVSGLPLVSQGATADPIYIELGVVGGGTGHGTFTSYEIVAGGTSGTAPLQQISNSGATAGMVLTYVGSAALATWQLGTLTIDGDTGSASGSTITISSGISIINSGSTVNFSATGSTVTLNVTNTSLVSTLIGYQCGNATMSGGANTGLGQSVMTDLTTGASNSGLGANSLTHVTNGSSNSFFGSGSGNTMTSGSFNSGFGVGSLQNLVSGSYNTCLGYADATNYTGSESSNILINNPGVLGESNTLRIGSGDGTSNQFLNRAFICGINGVTASNPLLVTINSATDQMGVIANGDFGVLISSSAGVPSWLANGTTGQVLTATTSGIPSWAVNTGGTSFVNQAASTVTLLSNTVNLINNGATLVSATLPSTSSVGDRIKILGMSAGGWKLLQVAGQSIKFSPATSTTGTGGSLASTAQYDTCLLTCIVANATWNCEYCSGTGPTIV